MAQIVSPRRSPPGVNYTNIFTRRFYKRSSQKHKSQSSCQYLFTLLGSACVKAVRRTLMKLSPGVNFNNNLQVAFTCADPKRVKDTDD